jgi:hypothetical protein
MPTTEVTKTVTTTVPAPQNVVVEKTVIEKKKGWKLHPIRNSLGCLIATLGTAGVIFLVTTIIFLGLWLRTWSVFTQERVIAYITVSPQKYDDQGNKYYTLTFEGEDLEAAFGRVFPWGEKQIKKEKFTLSPMYGDKFRIESAFFKWKDFMTFLGTPPLYKITSINNAYLDADEYNKNSSKLSAYPLNGGVDDFWKSILSGKNVWSWGASAYYGSEVSQIVTDKERKFELRVTEDGLILKAV